METFFNRNVCNILQMFSRIRAVGQPQLHRGVPSQLYRQRVHGLVSLCAHVYRRSAAAVLLYKSLTIMHLFISKNKAFLHFLMMRVLSMRVLRLVYKTLVNYSLKPSCILVYVGPAGF